MTDERRCPKCGSPFNFTPHQPTFCCGSQDCGGDDHEIMQSDKCRIAELEAEVARLTEQLKTPHPARDFVNEFNQLLASKDAEVARLKSSLAEAVAAERERCALACETEAFLLASDKLIVNSLYHAAAEIRKGPQP